MNKFNSLLGIAVILAVIWVVATATRFVAGVLLNLVLVAAVIFFGLWLFRRMRA
jgi:hypothetical protein